MATKKQVNEVPEGFTDTTKTEIVPNPAPERPVPAPEPERQVPTPEPVAGYQPLSDDEVRRVNQSKMLFDAAIMYLTILREAYHDAESQRMFAVAITNAETASMWAVRGITHRG
jgi:hypothetical protein